MGHQRLRFSCPQYGLWSGGRHVEFLAAAQGLGQGVRLPGIDGELSPNIAMRFSWTPSFVSHNSRSPTISRLEFVMVPLGFSLDINCVRTLSGHCHQKTVGVHAESLPNTIPPSPWLDASTIPTKSGHPEVNSRHRVGSRVDSPRSVHYPCSAWRTLLFLWR